MSGPTSESGSRVRARLPLPYPAILYSTDSIGHENQASTGEPGWKGWKKLRERGHAHGEGGCRKTESA